MGMTFGVARAAVARFVVAAAAVICVVCAFPPLASAGVDPQMDVQERWAFGEINRYRAELGRPPLESSSTLSRLADQYAQTLADMDTLDHYVGGDPTQRANAAGWVRGVAENLTFAGPDTAALFWHRSLAHDGIMLDPFKTVAGLGTDRNRGVWVLMLSDCEHTDPAVCANTHDVGDNTPDIYRIMIEEDPDPDSLPVKWWCEDARDPKPTVCAEIEERERRPTLPMDPPKKRKATGRSPKVRVTSVALNGRTATATVSVLRSATGSLRVSGTGFGWTAPAHHVSTRSAGPYVQRTYRIRLPRAGRYSINAKFKGRGVWGTRTALRFFQVG